MITIIGNGESRKTIDISKINTVKIGCNGIYLYDKVDMICAMDKFWREKISKETNIPLISRYTNNSFCNYLELYKGGKWTETKCKYRGYCSGISALDYICDITNKKVPIFMIGFDFGYKGDKVNHMYKGQQFHPKETRKAQNEDIFYKQFIETCKRYPTHNIIWVSDSDFPIKIKKIGIEEYKELVYVELD